MAKIKIKTNKSAAKRFKRTKSGKIKRYKASKSHLQTKKTSKRKKNLRKSGLVSKSEIKKINKMLPK